MKENKTPNCALSMVFNFFFSFFFFKKRTNLIYKEILRQNGFIFILDTQLSCTGIANTQAQIYYTNMYLSAVCACVYDRRPKVLLQ